MGSLVTGAFLFADTPHLNPLAFVLSNELLATEDDRLPVWNDEIKPVSPIENFGYTDRKGGLWEQRHKDF